MKFLSTRFGEIEFSEDVVLTMPDGVLGFPDDHCYILLEHNVDGSPFHWLQSLETPDLAFIVLDPTLIDPRFQIEIDRDTAFQIGTDSPADCAVVAIVNVPREDPIRMTANLKAPIVVNAENRVGRQLILSSSLFSISTPVFPALNQNLHCEDADSDAIEESLVPPRALHG